MAYTVANMNDVVIEKILRYEHYNTSTGELIWMANQLEDASLNITSDTSEVTDAEGSTIATFFKGRKAEFSATNALFNLGIASAQTGNAGGIERGGENKKINVPRSQIFTLDTSKTITLSDVPTGVSGAEIGYIYTIDGTGYNTACYSLGATANATQFALDAATKTITLPTGLPVGTRVMVNYRADINDAVKFSANGLDAPVAGRGMLWVKCHNVCDKSKIVYGILEFPNAQPSPDYEWSFTPDGKHAITLEMNQDYCDAEKILYHFYLAA